MALKIWQSEKLKAMANRMRMEAKGVAQKRVDGEQPITHQPTGEHETRDNYTRRDISETAIPHKGEKGKGQEKGKGKGEAEEKGEKGKGAGTSPHLPIAMARL